MNAPFNDDVAATDDTLYGHAVFVVDDADAGCDERKKSRTPYWSSIHRLYLFSCLTW